MFPEASTGPVPSARLLNTVAHSHRLFKDGGRGIFSEPLLNPHPSPLPQGEGARARVMGPSVTSQKKCATVFVHCSTKAFGYSDGILREIFVATSSGAWYCPSKLLV